jgi:hypothetical protein
MFVLISRDLGQCNFPWFRRFSCFGTHRPRGSRYMYMFWSPTAPRCDICVCLYVLRSVRLCLVCHGLVAVPRSYGFAGFFLVTRIRRDLHLVNVSQCVVEDIWGVLVVKNWQLLFRMLCWFGRRGFRRFVLMVVFVRGFWPSFRVDQTWQIRREHLKL